MQLGDWQCSGCILQLQYAHWLPRPQTKKYRRSGDIPWFAHSGPRPAFSIPITLAAPQRGYGRNQYWHLRFLSAGGYELAVLHLQEHFGQSGDTGGTFAVTNVGLSRADGAKLGIGGVLLEYFTQAGDLNRVAQGGSSCRGLPGN